MDVKLVKVYRPQRLQPELQPAERTHFRYPPTFKRLTGSSLRCSKVGKEFNRAIAHDRTRLGSVCKARPPSAQLWHVL